MKINIDSELVQEIYSYFCEAEGGVNHPLFETWCAYENEYGEIEAGSKPEELFIQTISFVVDYLNQ